ncbi:MAG: sigma-54-dependent Fis family transcriptional regulator, partial [Pedosphaera parvula]|nr:sigma-54-dependent Fis family transcriptional regulator [Pedosphaera parvula]
MNNANRLLLIEDDHALAISLVRVLEGEGYVVDHVATGDAGYRLACSQRFAAALTDLRLPGMGGMEVVQRLHDARPHLPVILLSAHGTAETAIEATKRGAYDYLLKPFAMPDLLAIVARALAQSRGKRGPGEDALPPAAAGQMVGRSRAMQELFKEIGLVASQQVTVL